MSVLRLALAPYPVERVDGARGFLGRVDDLAATAVRAGAELLVLPEYAAMEIAGDRGGDALAELAAVSAEAPALLEAMRDLAARHGLWLLPGSLPMPVDGGIRNIAPLIAADGRLALQQKSVMTRFERETLGISPGTPPAVFATPWGRIGIAICYDVEFPTLVRAQVEAGAWLILVPTCTDTPHGFNRVRLAARARALENQCFVAIAPTIGDAPWLATLDENHGYAAVFGPVDRGFPEDGVIARGDLDRPGLVIADLDPARLEAVRSDGAVRNFADWPHAPAVAPLRTPA